MDRVLDVRQGELSWVVGTIYMDMPMKPNVLDDLSKEVSSFILDMKLHSNASAALDCRTARSPEVLVAFWRR